MERNQSRDLTAQPTYLERSLEAARRLPVPATAHHPPRATSHAHAGCRHARARGKEAAAAGRRLVGPVVSRMTSPTTTIRWRHRRGSGSATQLSSSPPSHPFRRRRAVHTRVPDRSQRSLKILRPVAHVCVGNAFFLTAVCNRLAVKDECNTLSKKDECNSGFF
jgi:hypothetical protein